MKNRWIAADRLEDVVKVILKTAAKIRGVGRNPLSVSYRRGEALAVHLDSDQGDFLPGEDFLSRPCAINVAPT
jgi:hypothetical protein